jgi:hypothetical protein
MLVHRHDPIAPTDLAVSALPDAPVVAATRAERRLDRRPRGLVRRTARNGLLPARVLRAVRVG